MVGTVQAGTMRFIIISKCSFYKQECSYSGGKVVISAPYGWGKGWGGDSTGKDSGLYHHFQMQLLQTRVFIFRGAGSNLCFLWLGKGVGWGQYRQGQWVISSFSNAASANKSGQVVISAPVGWEEGWWGQCRAGTIHFIIISKCSFCKQE